MIGECLASIININNGIEEPTHGYQHCNTSQILIFGGYVKVRERLFTRVIVWVDTTVNHIDTWASSPRYEGCCILHGI